ncbi:MAG TPA: alpha/beta fold hydrolase [Candidatus Dormibacteraeota bacterium]
MELHVTRQGSGPPIVLTHGFAASQDVWEAQVEELAAHHTVVSWDLRGHGASAPPTAPYTRDAALADLAVVVESAGRPALLVGHSVGGYLSLAHAIRHPDTVAGLAVLSAGPGFRNPERRAAYNRTIATVAERNGFTADVAQVAVQHDSLVIDGLGGIACPTAVIVGADDLPIYVAGCRYLAANIPGARLVEVPGAGHDVHRERPDAIAAAIAELAGQVWG